MTRDVIAALAALAAIAVGGTGLAAALGSPEALALGWPLGLVVVEGVGLALAGRSRFWPVAAALALALAALSGLRRLRARPRRPAASLALSSALAASLLAVCAVLLALCAAHQPWIDSDAANHRRWIGLAKLIHDEGLPPGARSDPLGPSLLAAFVASGLSRWRDQAASASWLAAWLAVAGLSASIAARLRSRAIAAVLVCAYCTMPLLVAHVVKPGFAELTVVVMLLAGLCVLERRDGALRPGDWALVAAFAAGCLFGKKEAVVWAGWLLAAAATRELSIGGRFRWRQLVSVWAAATVAVVALHLWLGERLAPAKGAADDRIRWVYQHRWAPRAFARFAAEAFSASSFGLVWWWTAVAALILLVRSPADRGWTALSLFPIAGVVYFCCVTGNVEHTLLGDDVGRFLLQVSPVAFCLLVRWARTLERPPPAVAAAPGSR